MEAWRKPWLHTRKGRVSYGRVVGRANNNANANGGLVYANANNASSNSNTNYGSRLTLKVSPHQWDKKQNKQRQQRHAL